MKARNSRNLPTSQVVTLIRATVVVLVEVRVLIAEIMFTAAALYACYVAYEVLTHKVL